MRSLKWMIVTGYIAGALAAGCGAADPPSPAAPAAATEPAPSPNTAAAAPAGPVDTSVMAHVNGRTIAMAPLHELLVEAYGMEMAQQLIASELVNQAATAKGVTLTPQDIQAEHEITLVEMFPAVIDANQRQELWQQLLVERNVSRRQWDLTMSRNALLGKLVAGDVKVEPDEVELEFRELYGRKVVVRHIQTATLEEAQNALARLDAGEDFATLAREISKNPSAADGGLLQPIGARAEGVPAAFRDAALAMSAVGEIPAPVQVGTTYHILRLEQIIEPQEKALDEMRKELTSSLQARKIRSLKQQALADMIRTAKIEYVNPLLSDQAAQAEKEKARD